MSKVSITSDLLEVQLQGALPRALEKPPAGERSVIRRRPSSHTSVTRKAPGDATRARPTTLTEFQRAHAEQLLAPLCEIPLHARQHVRRGIRLEGSAIIFFESRPAFRSPQQWRDHPIAKFRWVKNRRMWQLFCVWRDLKWHRYEHLPESPDLAALVAEVRADPTGIFFG